MRRENGTGGYGPIIGEAFADGAAVVTKYAKTGKRSFKLHIMRDADDDAEPWVCEIKSCEVVINQDANGVQTVRSVGVLNFLHRGFDASIRVLHALNWHRPDTIAELVTLSKVPRRSVDRILSTLRAGGHLEDKGLTLTPSGVAKARDEASIVSE